MIVVIKWFHKVTNYQVLSRPNICGLQLMIDKKKAPVDWSCDSMKGDCISRALLSKALPHHRYSKMWQPPQ